MWSESATCATAAREKRVSGQRRRHRHRGLLQHAETKDRGAGESRNDGTEEAINYLMSRRPVSEASNLECKIQRGSKGRADRLLLDKTFVGQEEEGRISRKWASFLSASAEFPHGGAFFQLLRDVSRRRSHATNASSKCKSAWRHSRDEVRLLRHANDRSVRAIRGATNHLNRMTVYLVSIWKPFSFPFGCRESINDTMCVKISLRGPVWNEMD